VSDDKCQCDIPEDECGFPECRAACDRVRATDETATLRAQLAAAAERERELCRKSNSYVIENARLTERLAASEARAEWLAKSLRDCVEDTEDAMQNHINAFGANYKTPRIKALADQAAEARAALTEWEAGK
jgi:hypothetical protein